jgi:Leishmanolysin
MTGSSDHTAVISKITLALLEGIQTSLLPFPLSLAFFVLFFCIQSFLCISCIVNFDLKIDMGWYKVDYDQAEYLEWGDGMGCSFVNVRLGSERIREMKEDKGLTYIFRVNAQVGRTKMDIFAVPQVYRCVFDY